MAIRDTLRLRRRAFENSAATALIEASIPPIPKPVNTRQTERSYTPLGARRHDHPRSHYDEAAEQGAAAADFVRAPAEGDRADSHAEQFHREDNSQDRSVDAPGARNAGRGKTDGKHIETTERI